jgi:hypothetical protein
LHGPYRGISKELPAGRIIVVPSGNVDDGAYLLIPSGRVDALAIAYGSKADGAVCSIEIDDIYSFPMVSEGIGQGSEQLQPCLPSGFVIEVDGPPNGDVHIALRPSIARDLGTKEKRNPCARILRGFSYARSKLVRVDHACSIADTCHQATAPPVLHARPKSVR